ncbi:MULTISPECIES: SPOR domain-containing protein [unclassified Flavobacterium]|uniref:SPOR domain-containing protein n=1 Tax=unclassified Flavobacterium TaxID=196869 RepID=UPI00261B68A0|nr:SPOR domain-containing protein [Flavobacterium sp.]
MRILPVNKIHFLPLIALFLSPIAQAQTAKINIDQDPKFEQLLNEKRKINSSITVNDRYKIQIFYGTNDEAKKTLVNFRKEFRNMDGTIVYNNPSYKVWIGSFKTRIEAEKNLLDIKKKYPNALLIKPNKQ